MKFYAPTKISDNIRETPEGFLICLGVAIARTGDMIYGPGETPIEPGPDGRVIVQRDEKEVFRPETIASFAGKAVTILHPSTDVNPSNWSELAKGTIQNVRRGTGDQANDLIADLLITDAEAIGLVKRGLREVSCGYEAEYFQIEPGKGMHANIIGNHLALVEQGRAGMSYAINDHQRKGLEDMKPKTMKDKIKSIFAKAADEAAKVADEESVEETIVGDEDPKKDDKAKDAAKPTYDELVQICDAMKSEIAELKKGKDAAGEEKPVEEKAKDEEVAPGLEDRLKKLEMAVEKILSAESAEAEIIGDEDEGEVEEEAEEVSDAEEKEAKKEMTGDTAARAEILAPGIKASKDVKVAALKAAYGTKEGKAAIEKLTGGKAPTFDSAPQVEMLFVAASEILKHTRTDALAGTKKRTGDFNFDESASKVMTPEKINKLNAAKYGLTN